MMILLKKIRHVSGTDINECVQFAADPKKPEVVNLNLVSWGGVLGLGGGLPDGS